MGEGWDACGRRQSLWAEGAESKALRQRLGVNGLESLINIQNSFGSQI